MSGSPLARLFAGAKGSSEAALAANRTNQFPNQVPGAAFFELSIARSRQLRKSAASC